MQIREYVNKYDPQNQFDVLINSYKQIEYAWNNNINITNFELKKVNSIILSGLGGSAISGDLMQNFLKDELKIPLIVNRNYSLPSFVNEGTLVIVSSYSGNTEETLSVLNEAINKKIKIICVTTGGKIGKIAEENHLPVVKLQAGFQPRYALGLSFFTLLKILQNLNFIQDQKLFVEEILRLWKNKGIEFSRDGNKAADLAQKITGFVPVIYSAADYTSAVGYRLKCQLNENSNMHAFHNSFPEMNHNEIIGWETFNENSFNSIVINIIDEQYHAQIKKRFEINNTLLKKKQLDILALQSNEEDFKIRLMDLIFLCDWITYYASLFRGVDPSEIDNINYLKEYLSK